MLFITPYLLFAPYCAAIPLQTSNTQETFEHASTSTAFEDGSNTYLLWDNTTPASIEELIQDPLLIIRASAKEAKTDFAKIPSPEVNASTVFSAGRKRAPWIAVKAQERHFNFTKPVFHLSSPFPCTKIQWQISTIEDFSTVVPALDNVTDYMQEVTLSDLEETFLDNEVVYYFRVKSYEGSGSQYWSPPLAFTISKPEQVRNLRIESEGMSSAELKWDLEGEEVATYLVFGSDVPDFVPSINFNSIHANGMATANDHPSFMGETASNRFPIDESKGYYRVVSKIDQSYSKPSSLVTYHDAAQFRAGPEEEPAAAANLLGRAVSITHSSAKFIDNSAYIRPATIPENVWDELSPLFLPEDSQERAILDEIFSKRRVLGSLKAMSRSGFILLTDPKHKIIVAKHPRLKGYLFKIFLDTSSECEYYWWSKRVKGASTIQDAIDRYGYGHFMTTPKKWIYPLPPEPEAAEGSYPKHFVLVVEEMDTLKRKENRSAYRTMMTYERLNAFYHLLTELRLIDSVYADNTPFCRDGRMAFIDTEHALDSTRPVPLSAVGQYLGPEMLPYWEQLIINGIQ